jgi:TatD DNase family protein
VWVDSHCHLQFLHDGADVAIERAHEAGVTGMVAVGTDLESSRAALELASRHADVRATVGLHPHDALRLDEEWDDLVALAADPSVVAIGETGFDFHYLHSPAPEQEIAFRAQIRLAHELDRTLVIHSREAWDDTFRVLDAESPPQRTVFHCFTGGPDEARHAVDLGAHLSFSGIVSFPAAHDVRAAAASAPLERLLVETDAPYLTPVPHRGQENEPAFVIDVGVALAAAINRPASSVAAATTTTATRLLGPFGGV